MSIPLSKGKSPLCAVGASMRSRATPSPPPLPPAAPPPTTSGPPGVPTVHTRCIPANLDVRAASAVAAAAAASLAAADGSPTALSLRLPPFSAASASAGVTSLPTSTLFRASGGVSADSDGDAAATAGGGDAALAAATGAAPPPDTPAAAALTPRPPTPGSASLLRPGTLPAALEPCIPHECHTPTRIKYTNLPTRISPSDLRQIHESYSMRHRHNTQ
jgi:hypothetical protein